MTIYFLLFGLVIGSFLNVCICRIPQGESIIWAPSHCTNCGNRLKWYHLVPVLSYLFLQGKCGFCNEKISWRYPLVELVTGLIFLLLYNTFGLNNVLIPACILVCLLIVISFIDIELKIIPNKVVAFGAVAGLPAMIFFGNRDWISVTLGFVIGLSGMLLIAIVSKGGMGGGDVKMSAMLGIYLGWEYTLSAIFLASLLGAVFGLGMMLTGKAKRKTAIPFGPFLAAGAFIMYVWGGEISRWYWVTFS